MSAELVMLEMWAYV